MLCSVFSLKCFSDPDGVEMSLCEEKRGYRTCFIKYDHSKSELSELIRSDQTINLSVPGGQVTGRGCSTKNKLFFTECENHVMVGEGVGPGGRGGERICYCGTFLCNNVSTLTLTGVSPALLLPALHLLHLLAVN